MTTVCMEHREDREPVQILQKLPFDSSSQFANIPCDTSIQMQEPIQYHSILHREPQDGWPVSSAVLLKA